MGLRKYLVVFLVEESIGIYFTTLLPKHTWFNLHDISPRNLG